MGGPIDPNESLLPKKEDKTLTVVLKEDGFSVSTDGVNGAGIFLDSISFPESQAHQLVDVVQKYITDKTYHS